MQGMSMGSTQVVAGITALVVLLFVTLAAGSGTVAADDPVTLTVTVEDRNGDPVGNAEIMAAWEDGERTAVTASNGRAFVDVPEGADVELSIDHAEFVRNSPYLVENATEREVTVDVARKGSIVFEATRNQGAVADAEIVVRKDGDRVVTGTTDADGRFDTGAIERGEYTVRVTRSGHFDQSHTISVEGDVVRELQLERGSVTLSVTVRDDHLDDNPPIEDATVEIGDVATVRTLDGGMASTSVPVNTRLSVTASKDGYLETTESVRIRERDQELTLNTSREPLLSLHSSNQRVVVDERVTLTVVDEYDASVEGATIRRNGESVGQTGSDGTLTIRMEEPGEHELIAVRDDLESDPVSIRVVSDADDTPTDTPTDTPVDTPTEDDGVGFGVTLAVVAFVVGALLLRRRR